MKIPMETRILLTDVFSGEHFASAPNEAVQLTSEGMWEGFSLEQHNLAPSELSEHQVINHRFMINIGNPVAFENRIDNKWFKQLYQYGDFKFLPDKAPNIPRWHNNLNILAIAIDPQLVLKITEQEKINFKIEERANDTVINVLTNSLLKELKEEHFSGRIYAESLIITFVMHLVSHYQENGKKLFRPFKGKLSSIELNKTIDFVNDNLQENLSLEEMAKQVYMSSFHYSRLFRNTLGIAPHQYIMQIKLDKAKKMIKQGNYKLNQIASELGFSDQAHFNNAFKKAIGISPKYFRNK